MFLNWPLEVQVIRAVIFSYIPKCMCDYKITTFFKMATQKLHLSHYFYL